MELKNSKSLFTTPNPFEKQFGYHRAVRKGPFIFVAGTTALKFVDASTKGQESTDPVKGQGESKVEFPNDARAQARLAMQRCVEAVEKLGGRLEDVVRVRMYVSAHEDCNAVGLAFQDCFTAKSVPTSLGSMDVVELSSDGKVTTGAGIGAAATMVVIKNGYIDPDILVEVEVDAVCDQ